MQIFVILASSNLQWQISLEYLRQSGEAHFGRNESEQIFYSWSQVKTWHL